MTGASEARRGGEAELGGRSIRPRAKFLACGELREGQLLEVGKITVDSQQQYHKTGEMTDQTIETSYPPSLFIPSGSLIKIPLPVFLVLSQKASFHEHSRLDYLNHGRQTLGSSASIDSAQTPSVFLGISWGFRVMTVFRGGM
jgi:hypothetical protein